MKQAYTTSVSYYFYELSSEALKKYASPSTSVETEDGS